MRTVAVNTNSPGAVRSSSRAARSVVARATDVDSITRAVQSAVLEATRSGRAAQLLEQAQKQNEELKSKVLEEGQRASAASRELATITSRIKERDARLKQMQADRQALEKAEAQRMSTLAELEEVKRVSSILLSGASTASDPSAVEAEKAARLAAERKVLELEETLKNVTAAAAKKAKDATLTAAALAVRTKQAASTRAPPEYLDLSYPGDEEASANAAAQQELERLAKVNEVLKQQVIGETARAGAAKDLANARYKELETVAAKVREEERSVKRMKEKATTAMLAAKEAQEALAQAKQANLKLQEQVAEEEKRAAAAIAEAESLQESLNASKAEMAAEEAKIRAMMETNPDAKTAFKLRGKLNEAESRNQVLKAQVQTESARAKEAGGMLHQVKHRGAQAERLAQQVEEERQARMEATEQLSKVNALLQAEKQKANSIKAEAESSAQLIAHEKKAQAAAEARVKELEAALMSVNERASALAAAPAAALAAAQSQIETLKRQLAGENARVSAAKELAAARARDLASTQTRLKEEQKKLDLISREAHRAMEEARAARDAAADSASGIDEQLNEELNKQLSAQSARAQRAESQVSELQASLAAARAQMASISATFASATVDAVKLSQAQESLAHALATNEVLKKQVMAERSRAARTQKELTQVQGRILEVEQTLDVVKNEALSMKNSVTALRDEISGVLSVRTEKDSRLKVSNEELEKSRSEETELRAESSRLRHALDVARSRVMLLELEMKQEKEVVKQQ